MFKTIVLGATAPSTLLYIITALFGYATYYNRTESYLLELYELWLDPSDIMLMVAELLITLCIIFSVPILHYPCRYSMWNLLHRILPKYIPPAYDNGYPETWNRPWYYFFAVILQGGLYGLTCVTEDFGLAIALGGAVAGTCLMQVFPAMFYLKIHGWRYKYLYDKAVWFVGALGILTFFISTGMILLQHFSIL